MAEDLKNAEARKALQAAILRYPFKLSDLPAHVVATLDARTREELAKRG